MTHPLNDNIEALQQWSKNGELPGAPEKKKAGKLKFSVSNAAIKKMAASTLKEGGLEVAAEAPPVPATPRAPLAPVVTRPPRRGGLSGAFNTAARGGSSNNDNLSAMIQAGADMVAPTRPSAQPRYRFPSPSLG